MSQRARRLAVSAPLALVVGLIHCQTLLDVDPRGGDGRTTDSGAPGLDAAADVVVAPRDARADDAADAADGAVPYCAAAFGGAFFCNDFDHKFDWPTEPGVAIDATESSSPPNALLSAVAPNTPGCAFARAIAAPEGAPDVRRIRISALVFLDPAHFLDDVFLDVRMQSLASDAGTECQELVIARWNGSNFTLLLDQQTDGANDKVTNTAGVIHAREWTRVELDADFANGPMALRVGGNEVLAPPVEAPCAHGTAQALLGFHYACQGDLTRNVWFDDVVIETK